jgi:hypothetical protein
LQKGFLGVRLRLMVDVGVEGLEVKLCGQLLQALIIDANVFGTANNEGTCLSNQGALVEHARKSIIISKFL